MPNTWEEEMTLSPIQCMAPMLDRTVWVGYKKGQLEQFSFNGRFKKRCVFKCGLSCLCVVDDRMWVGLNDGSIAVMSIEFKQLKKWNAHEATVIDIAVLGHLVYSLAADGSIKGDKTDLWSPNGQNGDVQVGLVEFQMRWQTRCRGRDLCRASRT